MTCYLLCRKKGQKEDTYIELSPTHPPKIKTENNKKMERKETSENNTIQLPLGEEMQGKAMLL
jgi:hypothetical protein